MEYDDFKRSVFLPVKPAELYALKNLALFGALHSGIPISSREFGEKIGMSQQSASRLLRKLRDMGLIDMSIGRKSWITINHRGREVLMKEYEDYRAIFEEMKPVIRGRVESGLGEGRYYLSKSRYIEQIKEMFSFTPYPGTLNIRLSREEMAKYRGFMGKGVIIKGFISEGRTFGDVLGIPAIISGINCAVITPKRSHYSNVVEVIAPENLRKALDLEDGDEVEVHLMV